MAPGHFGQIGSPSKRWNSRSLKNAKPDQKKIKLLTEIPENPDIRRKRLKNEEKTMKKLSMRSIQSMPPEKSNQSKSKMTLLVEVDQLKKKLFHCNNEIVSYLFAINEKNTQLEHFKLKSQEAEQQIAEMKDRIAKIQSFCSVQVKIKNEYTHFSTQTDEASTFDAETQTNEASTFSITTQTEIVSTSNKETQTDAASNELVNEEHSAEMQTEAEMNGSIHQQSQKNAVMATNDNGVQFVDNNFSEKQLTNKSLYTCNYCNKPFSSKYDLNVHRTEHCKLSPSSIKVPKDHQCKGCKIYYTRNGLRSHLNKIVSGKRSPPKKHGKMTIKEHKALLDAIKVVK